jgi:hypothetical protein
MKNHLLIFTFVLTALVSKTSVMAQVIANQPSDLQLCSENDFAPFDLTITVQEVIGPQDPNDLTISFYETQSDAETAINTIIFPHAYINIINPQTIFVWLEKNSTGEFDTTSFNILVINGPIINAPIPLEICDDDADGFKAFNLNDKDNEISNGDPEIQLTYHETLPEAVAGVNPLSSPFINSLPFNQTVYVRAVSTVSGCTSFTTLQLVVLLPPVAVSILDLVVLDTDTDGDGFEFFDLTSKITEILNGQSNIDVTFYESLVDAITNINAISTPSAYLNTSNPQTIWTRL